jgi:hypothetical protein
MLATYMTFIRRFFYLFYYLRKSDLKQLKTFIRFSSSNTKKSKMRIIVDSFVSVFKYNISFKDYFCFRFYELKSDERFEWAGTGFMYEYQLRMNPKNMRNVLEDKIKFLHHFKSCVKREFFSLNELKNDMQMVKKMLANSSGRLVLKGSHGQVGSQVEVICCDNFSPQILIDYMIRKKYDLLEEYVIQHPLLMELSPSGLNTVRVITQLHQGRVEFLGARLRVSVNSPVDNMAAGNLAAPIDMTNGQINGPGVYSDITKGDRSIHPVTGKPITGFIIPHWNAVIELAKKAALQTSENRSVGWDIAITKEGTELIEGNHNWCKLLWQMPVKKGLRKELENYLKWKEH